MASYTLLLLVSVTTLFVAVVGAELTDDEAELLYQLYNEEMQKREDRTFMDYVLQKRGRGGSLRGEFTICFVVRLVMIKKISKDCLQWHHVKFLIE